MTPPAPSSSSTRPAIASMAASSAPQIRQVPAFTRHLTGELPHTHAAPRHQPPKLIAEIGHHRRLAFPGPCCLLPHPELTPVTHPHPHVHCRCPQLHTQGATVMQPASDPARPRPPPGRYAETRSPHADRQRRPHDHPAADTEPARTLRPLDKRGPKKPLRSFTRLFRMWPASTIFCSAGKKLRSPTARPPSGRLDAVPARPKAARDNRRFLGRGCVVPGPRGRGYRSP